MSFARTKTESTPLLETELTSLSKTAQPPSGFSTAKTGKPSLFARTESKKNSNQMTSKQREVRTESNLALKAMSRF